MWEMCLNKFWFDCRSNTLLFCLFIFYLSVCLHIFCQPLVSSVFLFICVLSACLFFVCVHVFLPIFDFSFCLSVCISFACIFGFICLFLFICFVSLYFFCLCACLFAYLWFVCLSVFVPVGAVLGSAVTGGWGRGQEGQAVRHPWGSVSDQFLWDGRSADFSGGAGGPAQRSEGDPAAGGCDDPGQSRGGSSTRRSERDAAETHWWHHTPGVTGLQLLTSK